MSGQIIGAEYALVNGIKLNRLRGMLVDTARKLQKLLAKNAALLKKLDASRLYLEDKDLLLLLPGLAKGKELEVLNLESNMLTESAIYSLAKYLGSTHLTKLKQLSLSDNQISDSAGPGLAQVLQRLCSLEHLDLSYNPIGPAVRYLTSGSIPPSLTSVNISGCGLSDDDAIAFLSQLPDTVRHVSMRLNETGKPLVQYIHDNAARFSEATQVETDPWPDEEPSQMLPLALVLFDEGELGDLEEELEGRFEVIQLQTVLRMMWNSQDEDVAVDFDKLFLFSRTEGFVHLEIVWALLFKECMEREWKLVLQGSDQAALPILSRAVKALCSPSSSPDSRNSLFREAAVPRQKRDAHSLVLEGIPVELRSDREGMLQDLNAVQAYLAAPFGEEGGIDGRIHLLRIRDEETDFSQGMIVLPCDADQEILRRMLENNRQQQVEEEIGNEQVGTALVQYNVFVRGEEFPVLEGEFQSSISTQDWDAQLEGQLKESFKQTLVDEMAAMGFVVDNDQILEIEFLPAFEKHRNPLLRRINVVVKDCTPRAPALVEQEADDRFGRELPFLEQQECAQDLLEMAQRALDLDCPDTSISSTFDRLVFAIFTPRFSTVQAQTAARLGRSGLLPPGADADDFVLMYSNYPEKTVNERFNRLLQAAENERTLLVLIADECHHAPTLSGAHNRFINNESLCGRKNVLVLLVSATPQNCLTEKTRIPLENVYEWNPSATLYRSMDDYVETSSWALPPGTHLVLRKKSDNTLRRIDVSKNSHGVQVRFGQHRWDQLVQHLNSCVEAAGVGSPRTLPRFHARQVENDYDVAVTLPSGEWELDPSNGFFDLLGIDLLKDIQSGNEVVGSKPPCFCDTHSRLMEVDCRPRKLQRVRKDLFFNKLRESYASEFGSRKAPKRSSSTIRIAEGIPLFDGHFLLVEYLLSLAFFAAFRIDYEQLWTPARTHVFHPVPVAERQVLEEEFVSRLLTEERLEAYAQSLGIAEKFGFVQDISKRIGCFSVQGKDASVQHVINHATKMYFAAAREELLPSNSHANDDDTTHWRQVFRYILRDKLTMCALERQPRAPNEPEHWWTETDRIVETLLDVNPKTLTGSMCVMRVYEKDENFSIQECFRNALRKLGLYGVEQQGGHERGLLSVVGDIGGEENSESSRLFSTLEPWAKRVDLRADRSRGKPRTIESIAAKRRSSLAKMSINYEDLENLPSIVILCEKGRMGDTFPHSFRFLDLRLRTSETYSTFVQEFGRVCRYPILVPFRNDVSLASIDELESAAEDIFRTGKSIVCKDLSNQILFHADSWSQMRSLAARGWEQQQEAPTRVNFFFYSFPLPTIFLTKVSMEKLENALFRKYSQGHGLVRLVDCIDGTLDGYVSAKRRGKRSAAIKIFYPESQDQLPVVENQLHSLKAYREHFTLARTRDAQHYDALRVAGEQDMHRRRLLLKAQCQQGKTGAYLHFLRLLAQEISEERGQVVWVEKRDASGSWLLPYWHDLLTQPSLSSRYLQVYAGQYTRLVLEQRLLALACSLRGDLKKDLEDTYLKSYLLSLDGECLTSTIGIKRAQDAVRLALENLLPISAQVKTIDELPDEQTFSLVNFDRRTSDKDLLKQVLLTYKGGELVRSLGQGKSRDALCTVATFVQEKKWQQPPDAFDIDMPPSSYQAVGGEERVNPLTISTVQACVFSPKELLRSTSKCVKRLVRVGGFVNNEVQVAVPMNLLGCFDSFEHASTLQLSRAAKDLRWVFIPSYNRSDTALINYERALERPEESVVVVVVRGGTEFEHYCPLAKHVVVLGMPAQLEWPGSSPKGLIHDRNGGIGFSRYFIQVFAAAQGLDWVWVLDDNVLTVLERTERGGKAICFDRAMRRVEEMLMLRGSCVPEEVVSNAISSWDAKKYTQGPLRGTRHPNLALLSAAESQLDVVGGAENYGIVGIAAYSTNQRTTEKEFKVTHSLYSFVALNVRATVAKGVFYPPKAFGEDLEFAHMLDENGLVPLKVNRFLYRKQRFSSLDRSQREVSSDDMISSHLLQLLDEKATIQLEPRLAVYYPRDFPVAAEEWLVELRALFESAQQLQTKEEEKVVPLVILEPSTKPWLNSVEMNLRRNLFDGEKCLVICRSDQKNLFDELNEQRMKVRIEVWRGVELSLFCLYRTPPSSPSPKQSDSPPPKQSDSTPLKQSDSTPLKQSDSTPLKQADSTPLKQADSTPLKQADSTPLKHSDSTPLKQPSSPEKKRLPETIRDLIDGLALQDGNGKYAFDGKTIVKKVLETEVGSAYAATFSNLKDFEKKVKNRMSTARSNRKKN